MDFPQLPNLIHAAIPFFVGFIVLEIILSSFLKVKTYELKDASSSIAMGLGNVFLGIIGKVIVFGAYTFVHQFALFDIGFAWWAWVLLFFAEDFSYYWFHRISHSVRFFWASHVVHHSSQHYNLSTALRQTWTGNFTGGFVFWLWLPLLGFEPIMIIFMKSISLLYQFWIHTEVIKKMPAWFEAVFNTPSHHRVHHSNEVEYLDRNHAGVLIIWDRMFGTFTAEKQKPRYGLTQNINTYNPLVIATHEWWAMIKDTVRNPRHAWGYVFGPPGWSHDGSRKTTADLRESLKGQKREVPHKVSSSKVVLPQP